MEVVHPDQDDSIREGNSVRNILHCISAGMLATQVLPEDTVNVISQDESEIVGYLEIDSKRYEIIKGENKIGRDPCCSIVIENCTISKLHAVIESDGRDETFIYDCGSTNLSRLKKKKLKPHCRYKLDDNTDIALGNMVATFKLAPKINSSEIKGSESLSVNVQLSDELDDIFDLPTQVITPGPSTSRHISKPPEKFKIPNLINFDKKQLTPSDCNSDSGFSGLENSETFNLSTQCQLQKPTPEYADYDGEKIKSLLNDGQDDVLCNFMLMHSPKCDSETGIDVFDAPTQVCVVEASANEDLKNMQPINDQVKKSVSEITLIKEGEGSVDVEKFDGITKAGICDVDKAEKYRETDGEDDVIFTQKFELSNNQADVSVLDLSLNDQEEDAKGIKKVDEVKNNLEGSDQKEEKDLFKETDGENDDDGTTQLETCLDLNSTQVSETGHSEFSDRVKSMFSNPFKNNEAKFIQDKRNETLSDLEIDKTAQLEAETEKFQNSNDSYTFEVVDEERIEIDSDATDCEVKPLDIAVEEIKFLTPIPPRYSQLNIQAERRSPSPKCWSPLSLEMPSTQDVQTTMDQFLGRENQAGNVQTDSPLKRSRDSMVPVDGSPAKKAKTEKNLLKWWQVHDVAEIQPTRTRRSLRISNTNKQSCRRSTRARKSNSDNTPYLIRCRTKKESPKENTKGFRSRKSETLKNSARKRNSKSYAPIIAFTGFSSEKQEKIIDELGGKKTDDLSSASVVVAAKVRRTVKFLCAIGLSLPITSPEWLTSSKKERKFVKPQNFILKDKVAEDKWEFDLRSSLERSKRMKLLEGYSVFATENTKPPVKDLLAIVECCGGTPIVHRPNIWPKKTIIVSCEEDKDVWPPPKVRNIKLVHYEFILTGVLRQKIDFKSYSLR